MKNEDVLYTIADQWTKLTSADKLIIGLKLNLVSQAAYMYSSNHLEEYVFVNAYKTKKLAELALAIEEARIYAKKQGK